MANPHDYDNGYICVDLDGTLAKHTSAEKDWKGFEHIGEPVELMVTRVKAALKAGYHIKIFTARAYSHGMFQDGKHIDAIGPIEKWCEKHLGQILEVTCQKAPGCVEIWDDRAFHALSNQGLLIPASPLDRVSHQQHAVYTQTTFSESRDKTKEQK